MAGYNYSIDEFPEANKVTNRLTWVQVFKLLFYVGLSIPTFFLNLLAAPFSGKRTSVLVSAAAAALRVVMTSTTRDDTLQKALFFSPMEHSFNFLRSYKSTRHYNKRFTEAKRSISRWVYEKEGRTKDDPVMIYVHGGGFETKVLHAQIEHVHTICKRTGISAMMIDYGVVPYFKFPTQVDECLDTYKALAQSCNKIIIAGDSAGGNLASAVALKLKELSIPLWGYYAVAPWVQLYPRDTGSWATNAQHDWITAPWLRKAAELYLDHGKYDKNKIAQPYLASTEDWKGAMPKNSLVVYGKCELFADMCADLIKTAKVTDSLGQEGAIHDHILVFDKSGPAADFVYATINKWVS